MSSSPWRPLTRLTIVVAIATGAVGCEHLIAAALGDHMIAIVLLLNVVVFAVACLSRLWARNTRP